MTRLRAKPDGLPYRVYERHGVREYSIGYKQADGTWAFRLKCRADDKEQIAELRREAITRAVKLADGPPPADSVSALIDTWVKFQEDMPLSAATRRADTTMDENKREIKNLKKAFGHMRVSALTKQDGYAYLDACVLAKRPAKGNKEISLMRTILELGVRRGPIKTNPFDGIAKLKTETEDRLVTDAEMALAVEMGRKLGGTRLIVALALKTAWLCVRRSVEVRALTRPQITDDGIVWEAAKRQAGKAKITGLIEWSDELDATVKEALAIKRNKLAGTWYVFGNLQGQRYTKGGWKKMLHYLMVACETEAAARGIPFKKFSLQDCRPKGVTDKMEQKADDVMDATMHTNKRMIEKTYDRRRLRVAKPVK
jgi:integrase